MHERRLFQADVHESRLHAWQHLGHLALIYVPDKIFVLGAVAKKIRDHTVIQHRHTSFFPCDGYRNFHTHTHSFRSTEPFEPTRGWNAGAPRFRCHSVLVDSRIRTTNTL